MDSMLRDNYIRVCGCFCAGAVGVSRMLSEPMKGVYGLGFQGFIGYIE